MVEAWLQWRTLNARDCSNCSLLDKEYQRNFFALRSGFRFLLSQCCAGKSQELSTCLDNAIRVDRLSKGDFSWVFSGA